MLPQKAVEKLATSKNLLAFSGGGDSSALFYLLLKQNIPFDIAIVDYRVRKQSQEEVRYAQELAKKYGKHCYVKTAPIFKNNFESRARKIRYEFFEELIETHGYHTLLTAHHLGDRLEWFLMQLCKGSGCLELAGMRLFEYKDGYTLVRPLLARSKEELLEFLKSNDIRYFHDATNDETRFLRNRFRHNFAEPLLKEYLNGIRRSFEYLDEDRAMLEEKCVSITEGEMICLHASTATRATLWCIDKELKRRGYVLSAYEKEQLKKGINSIVGRKYLVAFHSSLICIAPYSDTKPILPKKFKEECRKLGVEPKLRPFFFTHPEAFEVFKNLIPST